MDKVKKLTEIAKKHTKNENVIHAIVGYFLHLSHNQNDYLGATKEASYDLDLTDIDEFKNVLKLIVI